MRDDDVQSGSSGNTVLLVLGIVGGILLLLILACAGVGYFFVSRAGQMMQQVQSAAVQVQQQAQEIQQAQAAGNAFMDDIVQQKFDKAYRYTTKNFQTRQTLQELTALVRKNPAFKDPNRRNMNSTEAGPVVHKFRLEVSGPGGTVTGSLDLVKEEEQWKVDRFSIP